MRVLMYSDLHVSHKNGDYVDFLDKTVNYLIEKCQSLRPDILVNLGDTLDSFGVLDVRDGVYAQGLLDSLTEHSGALHVVLRGNHDTADKCGQVSSTPLVCRGEVTTVTHPVFASLGGLPVLYLPHSTDFDSMLAMIGEAKERSVRAVFTHVDWLGCRLTPAYVSREGLSPAAVGEVLPGVPVFAGHYHAPMTVGPVHFVGSPLYLNFSDLMVEQERGFLLWDTEAGVTRIPNPHTYKCYKIEAENKRELTKKLKDMGDPRLARVKVYVPKKHVEDAQDLVRGFLWSAVYPVEAERTGIEFSAQVNVRTPLEDAVRTAVRSGSEGYDAALLETFGLEAFRRVS